MKTPAADPVDPTPETNDTTSGIGPKLKALRTSDGLKLAVVAKDVGTTVATLSAIETSRIENPGYRQVIALAKYYGVTVEELVGDESSKPIVSNTIVKLAQRLTGDEQQFAENFMKFLISQRKVS